MSRFDTLVKAKRDRERFRRVVEVVSALVDNYAENHSRKDLLCLLSKLPDIRSDVLQYVQDECETDAVSMFLDFLMLQIKNV